jgi:hypothetical protein
MNAYLSCIIEKWKELLEAPFEMDRGRNLEKPHDKADALYWIR